MRISDWSSGVCSSDLPAEPVALGRLPRIGEVFLLELLVADHADVADLGRLAFLERQGHVDAVAVELAHRGGDLDVVTAAVVVLAGGPLGDAGWAGGGGGVALGTGGVCPADRMSVRVGVRGSGWVDLG